MRRISFCLLFFLLMFCLLACDKNSENKRQRGEIYGECYQDGTCDEGLKCDIENNICIKDPQTPEENDEDETDSDDLDIDSTDESDSDSDNQNDAKPKDPCDPNPCENLPHSNGECETISDYYSCGCADGYYWWGSKNRCIEKKPLTLGEICTGQTYCQDMFSVTSCPLFNEDYYGQDAQYAEIGVCVPQNFTLKTAPGQNIVVDNNTGLEWQQTASEESNMGRAGAEKYCNELVYGGYSDWRLPDPNEILTIVDNDKYDPATNSNFAHIPSNDYSSFLFLSTPEIYFNPYDGTYSYFGYKVYVLCVRGTKMATGVFTSKKINGDIVVTDAVTGLTWKKEYIKDVDWETALKYCENLDYAGRTDWRLPNKNELASLLNVNKSDIPYSDFPDMPANWFWSSTTFLTINKSALIVNFNNGWIDSEVKYDKLHARCVAGGRDEEPDDPCDPNPCKNIADSTGKCTAISTKLYSCGCADGYYWWESENACLEKKPLALGEICTGQTQCYDNASAGDCRELTCSDFYGQDAQYAAWGVCTPQNFTVKTVDGQNIVSDNNTGLVWQQSPSSEKYIWGEAKKYCEDLNKSGFAGFSNGWRAPTVHELLSIADNGSSGSGINPNFTNISSCLWSSEIYSDDWKDAYGFSFGYTGVYDRSLNCNVLCVHGSEMPKAVFMSETVGEDVIVTDSTTGLIWQKNYDSKKWTKALKYCEDLDYAGRTDWRLPNKNELASLLNLTKSDQCYSDFPDMDCQPCVFWSSSAPVRVDDNDYAWFVDFKSGGARTNRKIENYAVRCVAGGGVIKLENPCEPNPCGNFSNSTGVCQASSEILYSCGCADGYYWWGVETGCVAAKPMSIGRICTGQTKCYGENQVFETCPAEGEDFYGQDAHYAALGICLPPSFSLDETVPEQKLIVDNNTGLKWQQTLDENTYTWEDAQNYCNNLNYAGFSSGWRLPTPLEFIQLTPAINTTNFPNMKIFEPIWSSVDRGIHHYHWLFNYPYEKTGQSISSTFPYQVICVHGSEMPKAVFATETVSGNEVVKDLITGLMWQKEADFNGSWQAALKYCEDLDYAGYTDWRLPNKNELASLLNYDKSMTLYSDFPIFMPSGGRFWSSTSRGIYINFYTGEVSYDGNKTNLGRCVRNAD
ncbi:DUF1566 domain-containing protein [bacterium]|nr:DUF1566 domain-containing protein [bacterium]